MLWATSPAASELERALLDQMGRAMGLPESFLSTSEQGGGCIQSTASDATLAQSGPSNVPGAGSGLFAGARGAEPGECVALFGGRVFVPPPMGVEVLSEGGTRGSRSGKELLRSDGVRIDPGLDCAWLPGMWASGALINDGLLCVEGAGETRRERVGEESRTGGREEAREDEEDQERSRENANVVPADVCCASVLESLPPGQRPAIARLLGAAFVPHVPWYVDAELLAPVDPPTLDGGGAPLGAALLATRRLDPGEEIFLDCRLWGWGWGGWGGWGRGGGGMAGDREIPA